MALAGQATDTKLHHITDERWRYLCPNDDCRCPTITVRRQLGDPKKHTEYTPHLGAIPRTLHIHSFRCARCGATFDEPYDAKQSETRPLHHIE